MTHRDGDTARPSPTPPREKPEPRADLEKRFLRLESHRNLLPEGHRILMAVSGGLDSTVLFHLLNQAAGKYSWTLCVGHVHHGLRDRAGADADIVRRMAGRYDIPYLERRVTPGFNNRSEAWARKARFEALEEMRIESRSEWIALAHTSDDQAETLLMNLIRGTGPRGLGGPRERRGRILRPLLHFSRADLVAYARARNLTWCIDRSNWNQPYTRNWIRHRLLPLLASEGNPRIRENLSRLSGLMGRWVATIDQRVGEIMKEQARWDGSTLHLENIPSASSPTTTSSSTTSPSTTSPSTTWDDWLQCEVIREAHRRVNPEADELTEPHLAACRDLLENEARRLSHLPGSVVVEGRRGELHFSKQEEVSDSPEEKRRLSSSDAIYLGRMVGLRELSLNAAQGRLAARKIRAQSGSQSGSGSVKDGKDECWEIFDLDAIQGDLWIRPWRDGDKIQPYGMRGRKLISDLLNEARISTREKRNIPVVEDDAGILWVMGIRRANRALLTDSTRRTLEVHGFFVS